MEFKHLPLSSEDGTRLNIEALYKLFPSCFTEARDKKTGELRHVVDFKRLREMLGKEAVEDEPEAYEFTWVGKRAAKREAATPTDKTLRPVPESSVNWDNTKNVYIEGDNLDALKLLQKAYVGKVKMIYIDPPYNTGNDFVYHDDFKQTVDEYEEAAGNVDELGNRFVKNTDSNGRFHSDWCSMIYPRLRLAHSLLSRDGVIFISIDDNEVNTLKNICDEIFGESNFQAAITWRRRTNQPNDKSKMIAKVAEFILVYSKDDFYLSSNKLFHGVPLSDKRVSEYTNPDNDPNGPWSTNPWKAAVGRGGTTYDITTPLGITYHETWYGTKDTFEIYLKEGRVHWTDGGKGVPRIKIYLKDVQDEGQSAINFFNCDQFGSNQEGSAEVEYLFNKKGVFDNPKPTKLIKSFVHIASEKDSIILDFFSGSATTADAVMQINAEDEGHRKYILVQLPEEVPETSEAYGAGFKRICEIGEERIRRAGKKIEDELKEKQPDLFAQGNGNKPNLDTGFRVYRIDSSNMKDVYFAPKDLDPKQLNLFEDNVKEDRTELDLLYGCILDWGLQLSLPMTTEKVDGVTIYTVNEGDLVACFGKPITDNVVKAMADKTPRRVLFRDRCFDEDEQKINIFEQFKQQLGWSDDEALQNIRVV